MSTKVMILAITTSLEEIYVPFSEHMKNYNTVWFGAYQKYF